MEPTENQLAAELGATIKKPVRMPNTTATGASFKDVAGAAIGNNPMPQPQPAPANVLRASQQQAAPNPRESSGVITQATLPDPPVQQAGIATPPAQPQQQAQQEPLIIEGVRYQNLPDQKFPGPFGMAASAMGSTIAHIATSPFGNRAEERLAANRAGLIEEPAKPALPASKANPLTAAASLAGLQTVATRNEADLAGRQATHMIENNLRQFEDKGNGIILTVGADGRRTLSNVGTENVTDPTKKVDVQTFDMAGLNNSLARENAVRQSMIDAQPVGGVAILPDQNAEWDAAFDKRREIENIFDMIRRAKSKSERAAYGQALSQIVSGQNQLAVEKMRWQNQLTSEQGRNAVTMRGQDLQSQAEAARLAGNPLTNELAKTQIEAGKQANAKGQAQNDLLAKIRGESDPAKRMALIDSLMAGQGKNPAEHRYVKVDGGEEIGPDGMTKIKRPSGVFDTQTQQFIPMTPQQQGGGAQKFSSPADVAAAKAAGKLKAGDVIETPNGLMKVS